jgi:hypothetical protein
MKMTSRRWARITSRLGRLCLGRKRSSHCSPAPGWGPTESFYLKLVLPIPVGYRMCRLWAEPALCGSLQMGTHGGFRP